MHAHTQMLDVIEIWQKVVQQSFLSVHTGVYFKFCHAAAVINSDFIWKCSLSICSNKSSNICFESLTTETNIYAMYSM